MAARWLVCVGALWWLACPSPLRRPESQDVVVTGTVTWGGFERRADPLEGAVVTLSNARATRSATSLPSGNFRVSVPAPAVQPGVFSVWAPGFAPEVRPLTVGPKTELQLSVALEPLEAMDCDDARCTTALGDVQWLGAPSGAVAKALALAAPPVLPMSGGVLASVALEVEPDTALSGELRVRLPRSTWTAVADVKADSGVLEVALAALEPSGQAWTQTGVALLRTELGVPIAETELSAIRRGAFAAGVVASVPVSRRAVLGLFGAAQPTGCLEGSVSIDGAPTEGVTVVASGVASSATDGTGAVCLQVPVSVQLPPAPLQYAGVVYQSIDLPTAMQEGVCGSGCRALGALTVRPEAIAPSTACKVTARVVDAADGPVTGAVVIAMDDGLTGATFAALCGRLGTRCTLTGSTDASGQVALVVPVQTGLLVSAKSQTMAVQAFGSTRRAGCPAEPVTVRLTRGRELVSATAQFVGPAISWAPPAVAFGLTVERAGGTAWQLTSTTGFSPPLVFGQVPSGAVAEVPASGGAMSGDAVTVSFGSVRPTGLVVFGSASAARE